MAQLKDLLVEGKSRFIDKIYASDQFISKVVQGTSPFLIDSSTLVSNLNVDMVDGQHFTYSNTNNTPTYLWGTSSNGTNYLVSRASMHSGIADKVSTIASTATGNFYLTFVDSNNTPNAAEETLYTSAKLYIQPSTGNIITSGYVAVGTGNTYTYIGSDSDSVIWIHNSSGYPIICDGVVVRRSTSLTTASLGSSSVPWPTVYGTNIYTRYIEVDSSATGATAHIKFNRANFNYLQIPTGGTFAVSINGASGAATYLAADASATYPGYHNKTVDLGTSSYSWKDLYIVSLQLPNNAILEDASGRVGIGTKPAHSSAKGLNVGDLLVSNAWADRSKVPTNGIYSKGQIKSGVAQGTAPFIVDSSTVVAKLNADLLDGEHLSKFWKHGHAYPYGKTDKPWHLIGEYSQSNSGQINVSITFFVAEFYSEISYGILTVRARSEGSATTMSFYSADWSLANNINVNNFVITWKCVSNVFTLKIYCKRSGWSSYAFRKIEEQSWGNPIDVWILHTAQNQNEYCLAAIPSDETQVVSNILAINNSAPPATHNHDDLYLKLAGGWMNWNAQIYFKGLNESTSVYSKIGYATSASGQTMHCVNNAGHQANGAFYITSNGSTSANDTGGLAIDNEGVTVFGAGDAGSNFTGIFRVLNEDNVADGPQFIVTKASGATTKYSHTAQKFISTVATGTQPYACTSTTLNTNLNADLLDGKHADDFLYRLRRLNLDVSHEINGMFPPSIFELKSAGYPLFTDPEFASGNNSFTVYNNSQNGTVTITREQAGDHANSSGYQLKIVTDGTATPSAGGFYQSFTGRANAIFVQIIRAKVPLGYNVNATRNSQGTGNTYTMLTDNKGTGKWEWYAVLCYCGTGGSFSNAGFIYLSTNGTVADVTNTSVTWYVSYANVIDITKSNYDGLKTRYADSADSISSWAESSGTDYRYVWHSGTGNGAKAAYKSSLTFCPNTGDLKVTSLNANDSTGYTKIYPGYIQIRKNTAANPTANYASIEFSYGSGQNVYIGYTPNDSYRAPAGLKVFGGSGATPAWFEVEGQIISSVATGTAPFIVTSTTKVANLYADKADIATRLGQNTEMTYGWSGINYFNISAANQSAAKVNDTPYSSATWTHILRFNHANNSGYYTDLAVPFNANGVYYKRIQNGTLQNSTTNGGWVGLLDVLNYSNYAQTYTAQEGAVNHFGQHVTVESTVTKDPANNGYYATGTLRRISQMNFNGYTVWTVSGYFKAASAITVNINLCDKTSNSVYGENSSSVSLTTSYVYHKFTYDNVNQYNTSSAYNGFLDIEGSSDVVVYVKDLMIEHGYVAHEWRPSLSDSTTKVKTITNSTNSSHYLTFVDSNNSSATEETLYTSSKLTINPSTGYIGINVTNPSSPIDASGGYLKVTYNGNTLSIGSGNTSFTHFSNSASREFYFSNAMTVNGNLRPYVTKSFSSGTTSSRWTKVYVTDGLDSSGALNLTSAANTAINFIQGTATNMALSTAGVLTLKANVYTDTSAAGSLNLQNSNIYGVNSLIFADACENGAEGIQFYRDATHADTIWDNGGILYYAPNRPYGSAGTSYKIWHEGNDGSGSGLDADLLDGYHASNFAVNTSKHYSSVDTMTADSSAWYNIFTISDSTSGAALCIIKAYAHSSLTFVVSKGYSTTTTLQILEYNYSGNASYFYVKGVRILSDGKVQALFNKTSGASTYINVDINIFSANGSLKPNDTLTLETAALSDTTTPSVCISLLGTHKKMTTDIVGSSTKIQTVKRTTNASHYLTFVDSNNDSAADESLYTSSNLSFNPSTNVLTITSSSGQQQELTVTRSGGSSISVMVGTGNTNHGLYSNTASKWIVYSDAAGNVTLNGNAATATSASSATTSSKVKTIASTATGNYYLTFVDSNNSSATDETVYTSAKLYIQPSTGNVYSSGRVFVNNTTTALGADNTSVVWLANSSGYPLVASANVVRRGASLTTGQLGDSTYPWAAVYSNMIYANVAGSNTAGGISLYSTTDPLSAYGIVFRGTGTSTGQGGKLGRVQGDWATYFTMNDSTNRGWIFRRGTTNVASIAGQGEAYLSAVGFENYIAYPKGAQSVNNAGSVTGAIAIRLPSAATKSCTMLKMTVEIYNYVGGTSSTYVIAGYNYTDWGWHNCTAYSLRQGTNAKGDLTIRYGDDGTRQIIWIGETNTAWSYPQVYVKDVTLGHSGRDFNIWAQGWEIGFDTSLGTVRTTISTPAINNFATNSTYASILRDPDYYDYSHRRTSANINWADGGLHYYLATSSMTTGKPAGDGHILHMSWDNGSYEGQFVLPTSTQRSLQWRSQNGGTWSNWITVLDSSNYSSYFSDTKVTQTITASSNTSWRPLLLGYSYSDAATFAPATVTNTTYATHLAKFKPSTGQLALGGLYKMNTNGTVATGANDEVWNTNGTTVKISTLFTTEPEYLSLEVKNATSPSTPVTEYVGVTITNKFTNEIIYEGVAYQNTHLIPGTTTYTTDPISIPPGIEYVISCSPVSGFKAPEDGVFLSIPGYSRTVQLNYTPIRVDILSFDFSRGTAPSAFIQYTPASGTSVIQWIRNNSHRYAAYFAKLTSNVTDGNNAILAPRGAQMYICQLKDSDSTKFANDNSYSYPSDGSVENGDIYMRLPEFYYRVSILADCSTFTVEFADSDLGEGFQKWDSNNLISVYPVSYTGNVVVSSGGSSTSNKIDAYCSSPYKETSTMSATDVWLSSNACKISAATISSSGYTIDVFVGGVDKTSLKNLYPDVDVKFLRYKWIQILRLLFMAYYQTTDCVGQCGTGVQSTYTPSAQSTQGRGMTDTTSSTGNNKPVNFWGVESLWCTNIYTIYTDICWHYYYISSGNTNNVNLMGLLADNVPSPALDSGGDAIYKFSRVYSSAGSVYGRYMQKLSGTPSTVEQKLVYSPITFAPGGVRGASATNCWYSTYDSTPELTSGHESRGGFECCKGSLFNDARAAAAGQNRICYYGPVQEVYSPTVFYNSIKPNSAIYRRLRGNTAIPG